MFNKNKIEGLENIIDLMEEKQNDLELELFQKDKIIEDLQKKLNKKQLFKINQTSYIDLDIKKIEELKYKYNLSNYKIAKMFKCSEGTIRNRLKQNQSTNKSKIKFDFSKIKKDI